MVEPGCQFVNPFTDEIKQVINTKGENLVLERIVAYTSDKVDIVVQDFWFFILITYLTYL